MDRVPVLLQRDMQYYQVDILHYNGKTSKALILIVYNIQIGTSICSSGDYLPWCRWWKT